MNSIETSYEIVGIYPLKARYDVTKLDMNFHFSIYCLHWYWFEHSNPYYLHYRWIWYIRNCTKYISYGFLIRWSVVHNWFMDLNKFNRSCSVLHLNWIMICLSCQDEFHMMNALVCMVIHQFKSMMNMT